VSNTDGRTDGLTKNLVTLGDRMTLSYAREEHQKMDVGGQKRECICLDELSECPSNCLLRWF